MNPSGPISGLHEPLSIYRVEIPGSVYHCNIEVQFSGGGNGGGGSSSCFCDND